MEIQDLYSLFLKSSGVSTDTRTIKEGDLFFALSGENFNGNKFAEQALKKGAIAAVIDDPSFDGANRILVDDTLRSLQAIANHHRRNFKGPVIAITGSNGKTTTKELVREVLAKKYRVQATEGNFNNHIGVPLTILKWTEETEVAIVEMGANHVGEIGSYCKIAEPSHGMITNIGHAHTETFGGIEGVLRGKTELFDYLRKSEGTVFINVQDERLKHLVKRFNNPEFFPRADVQLGDSTEFMSFNYGDHNVETRLTGDYNLLNVAAAISIGEYFNIPESEIIQAIEGYIPSNLRSQIVNKGDLTIILDAYNANPDSMRGALENLARFDGHKIAILGDMNELANSDDEHRAVGKQASELDLDELILVGEKIRPVLESNPGARHFLSAEEVLKKWTPQGPCTILIKASRTIKLESIVDKL